MAIRRTWLVLAAALIPAAARANGHKIEYSVAPSYASGSTLFGFYISGAGTLNWKPEPAGAQKKAEAHPWSVPLDLGVHFGSKDESKVAFMTGIRYMRALMRDGDDHTMVTLFGQALAGGADSHKDGKARLDGAVAFSGGVDLLLWQERNRGIRVQVDVIKPHGTDHYPRVSIGFVQRFEGHEHEYEAAARKK